ncbi:cAMP-dependent protein kinase catalytic subunit alpha-like [Macrosteles quadrilineatus]|uniref:cAMP-dependent protein kinase catalytic subunit alpha-like n=1 Tax=Macrosteles quadrilineatus TaxID=74068 RepID=UPI0023E14258|nr:cAMP-dependent protein kinase catalytic subunit alpha-like [Macrosteles quadrilineatus]
MSFSKDTKCNLEKFRFPECGPCEIGEWTDFLIKSKEHFTENWNTPFIHQEQLCDFEQVTLLGSGGFGEVILIKHKDNTVYYAMKAIEKEKVVKCKAVSHIKSEKLILKSISFPLAVYLIYSFKDNSYIYMVMPFVEGGELYSHLKDLGHFTENQAKFFMSQVILAIEYLHYMDVIYRDLKPENILIDHTGYLKLTDFGHSKLLTDKRTYTLCGTPEYLAPEIIMCKPYGKAIDWWAVGILAYEFVGGNSPFAAYDTMTTYERIVYLKYKMPRSFSSELKDLVKNLLQRDLTRRYGNLKRGVDDIKCHKWFKTINWLAILNRRVTAPFQPKCVDPSCIENAKRSHWKLKKISSENQFPQDFEDF